MANKLRNTETFSLTIFAACAGIETKVFPDFVAFQEFFALLAPGVSYMESRPVSELQRLAGLAP